MEPETSDNHKTSRQYEKIVHDLIRQNFTGIDGVNLVEIAHDAKLVGTSGYTHQIDVCYRFRIWKIEILVIVECKQYARPVGVDDLLEFKSRIDDLKAHKGLFVTSSGFQDGARQFARGNRIALLVARGTTHWDVAYCLGFVSPREKCQRQISRLQESYGLSDSDLQRRIRIDDGSGTVVVSNDGAVLHLAPFDLHKSMLYLQPCALGAGDGDDLFFEDERFGNLRSEMVLKALVLEELLEQARGEESSPDEPTTASNATS